LVAPKGTGPHRAFITSIDMKSDSVNLLLIAQESEDAQATISELKRLHLANGLVHVENGNEALDFLCSTGKFARSKKNDALPTIIMLNIQMSGESGVEVLKRIKSDGRTNTTPVVLLTPSPEHPDLHDCYSLGATCYIVKPLNFERFAQAIHRLGFFWLLLDRAPRRAGL
jgi:CheY-like chemotaxis protein